AYVTLRNQDQASARNFALAYADLVETPDQSLTFFDTVSRAPESDRREVVRALRDGGRGIGVVKGASLLPQAQSRAVMRDFLLEDDGQTVDSAAADALGRWLADAGR